MISVIVPVYNVEKYIRKCVDSICNQTYKDLEIILVDDGSTDNSGNICDEYKAKDSRIKVVHKNNGGLSDARNAGIEIAKGGYIAFIDSDDYIHERMYEVLMNNLEMTNSDISACEFVYKNENINEENILEIENLEIYSGKDVISLLWTDNVRTVVQWNKVYKKCIFDTIRYPIGRYHEDTFAIHHILSKCSKIVFTNQKLYYYVQHENSIMSVPSRKRIDDVEAAYVDRIHFFKDKGNDMALHKSKEMLLNELVYIADTQIRNNNIDIVKYVNNIYRKYYLKYFAYVKGKKYVYLFIHYKLYKRYSRM
jgi:glycosyltransferase involved in cell wall biosynthesis